MCTANEIAQHGVTLGSRSVSRREAAAVKLLRDMFDAAVAAASAENTLPAHLPPPPRGRTIVIGAGKAAASMAKSVESHWDGAIAGRVVTRYGHGVDCQSVTVVEAAHPVPDGTAERAARDIVRAVSNLGKEDLVICLISGGGSSLLTLPAPGISLADKQRINKALLRSGATISEINCVRKHLSSVKGGKLAAACAPASVLTLIISDVPGDDPSVVASGPTVPDTSTLAEAKGILSRYSIDVPSNVRQHLGDPKNETPKPGDPDFARTTTKIIATCQQSLNAAARIGVKSDYAAIVLGEYEGESRQVAKVHAALARRIQNHDRPAKAPCVIVSGGETTVTVRGDGRGGRNAEFGLSLAIDLQSAADVYAIACDTDGIDGTEDNAGCLLTPATLRRAAAAGLEPGEFLVSNDSYGFFDALGDLIVTGPTRTNVSDFRAILIDAPAKQ